MTMVLLALGGLTARAEETYRRLVNFEWEQIEDAKGYEIEIQQLKKADAKKFSFKVKETAWNGKLTPGTYTMRQRTLDYRGVPGEWSEASEFEVALEPAKLGTPADKSKISAKDEKEYEVPFQWQPVGGAVAYKFMVMSDDGQFKKEETVDVPKIKVKVPVARTFTWQVLALGKDDVKADSAAISQFTLLGQKLAKPSIEKPENEFVREVKWQLPPYAEKADVTLSRLNPATQKWEKVQAFENAKADSIAFQPGYPGGQYKVQVRARGDMRVASDVVSEQFKVRGGDRSPAAEFNAEVKKSIDRINGWYGIASYLITQVAYTSVNYDTGAQVSYPAVGGTGRLGVGWFKPEQQWGFLGILDLSGFINDEGKNLTFASLEANSVWRHAMGDRNELRLQAGMFYKEIPEVLGDPATRTVISYETISFAGPHVAAEYWFSLTPKLGLQLNAHMYMSMMKMKTPNGNGLSPSLSNQFGFLGSYRFSNRFTGLMGYARREDKVKYEANPLRTSDTGKQNETLLQGHYLNFYAEYAF